MQSIVNGPCLVLTKDIRIIKYLYIKSLKIPSQIVLRPYKNIED